MTDAQKIVIVQERIDGLIQTHQLLSDAITSNPDDNKTGQQTRQSVLADLSLQISALESTLQTLNQ